MSYVAVLVNLFKYFKVKDTSNFGSEIIFTILYAGNKSNIFKPITFKINTIYVGQKILVF